MNTLFNTIPRLSWILADNSIIRFLTLIVQFWYFSVSRKFISNMNPSYFNFKFKGVSIPMYLSSNIDIAALKEIYLLKEYEWDLEHDVKKIIDLGAHIGDTALYYHALYPQAKIIAVEPSPSTFEILKRNTEDVPNIITVNGAVGVSDGVTTLHITESSLGTSVHERKFTKEKIQVKEYGIDSIVGLLKDKRADLIKFDIEGAEEGLFTEPHLFSTSYIGEVHFDLMSISEDSFFSAFEEFSVVTKWLSGNKRCILKATNRQIIE